MRRAAATFQKPGFPAPVRAYARASGVCRWRRASDGNPIGPPPPQVPELASPSLREPRNSLEYALSTENQKDRVERQELPLVLYFSLLSHYYEGGGNTKSRLPRCRQGKAALDRGLSASSNGSERTA